MKKIFILVIMAVIISFLGFVLENVWLAVTKGYIDNRNMTLPFLLGYGLLVVGFYVIFGSPDSIEFVLLPDLLRSKTAKKVAYFALAFTVVSVGEVLLGFATEKFFGFFYWNYECLPLHITRYTSVPTSIGFALIITGFMDYCFVPALTVLESLSIDFLCVFSVIMFLLITVDTCGSFYKMHKNREENQRWVVRIGTGRHNKTITTG